MCNFSSQPHPSVSLVRVKVENSSEKWNMRVVRTRFASRLFPSFLHVAVLSETVASIVRRFISFCDSCLKGAPGALDLRSAADQGADRTGDSTGGRAHVYRGDNKAEEIVAVPQIQEQNVEVAVSANALFLLRACGEGASTGRACCTTVSPTRECWCILS